MFTCVACDCLQTGCRLVAHITVFFFSHYLLVYFRNCSIDALFGEEQCACLNGYTGERCDMCADGYFSPPFSDQCILCTFH